MANCKFTARSSGRGAVQRCAQPTRERTGNCCSKHTTKQTGNDQRGTYKSKGDISQCALTHRPFNILLLADGISLSIYCQNESGADSCEFQNGRIQIEVKDVDGSGQGIVSVPETIADFRINQQYSTVQQYGAVKTDILLKIAHHECPTIYVSPAGVMYSVVDEA
ncbi:hypothetical protein CBL_06186 [Carabus blaptoides fortunei]